MTTVRASERSSSTGVNHGPGMAENPVSHAAAKLKALGAHGIGQSSWGPTVFALIRGAAAAGHLADAIMRAVGDEAVVWCTGAGNRGACCRVEP